MEGSKPSEKGKPSFELQNTCCDFFCSVYTLSSNFTSLKRVFKKKKKSLYLGCFLFKNVLWWWQQWPSKSQMFLEQLYSFNVWVLIFSEKVLPCFIGTVVFVSRQYEPLKALSHYRRGEKNGRGIFQWFFKQPFLLITNARLKKNYKTKQNKNQLTKQPKKKSLQIINNSKTIHSLPRKETAHPKVGRGRVLFFVLTRYELWPLQRDVK